MRPSKLSAEEVKDIQDKLAALNEAGRGEFFHRLARVGRTDASFGRNLQAFIREFEDSPSYPLLTNQKSLATNL